MENVQESIEHAEQDENAENSSDKIEEPFEDAEKPVDDAEEHDNDAEEPEDYSTSNMYSHFIRPKISTAYKDVSEAGKSSCKVCHVLCPP